MASSHAFARPAACVVWPLLLLAGSLLSSSLGGCGESHFLGELEGTWRFTFRSETAGVVDDVQETLRLSIDGSRALITPIIDGASRIDRQRPGTIEGEPSGFTLRADWPVAPQTPAGCTAEFPRRTLQGRLGESISGTWSQAQQMTGSSCPTGPVPWLGGVFGAQRVDGDRAGELDAGADNGDGGPGDGGAVDGGTTAADSGAGG